MACRFIIASWLIFLPLSALAGSDRLPDGGVAQGMGLQAWYAAPTGRYDHGILGDGLEASALVISREGKTFRLDLPPDSVFEDLTPRIVDADGDGQPEVLTIKSTLSQGASIALYGLRNDALVELAEAPPIGAPHRWLNPAGVADFDGDGQPEIAVLQTPHIGGILVLYRWDGKSHEITEIRRSPGYSTHEIGSRSLGLALVADWDGDGVEDLLLPSQDRKSLIALSMIGDRFTVIHRYNMRREITGDLVMVGNFLKIPLRGGINRTLTRPYNPEERKKKAERKKKGSD